MGLFKCKSNTVKRSSVDTDLHQLVPRKRLQQEVFTTCSEMINPLIDPFIYSCSGGWLNFKNVKPQARMRGTLLCHSQTHKDRHEGNVLHTWNSIHNTRNYIYEKLGQTGQQWDFKNTSSDRHYNDYSKFLFNMSSCTVRDLEWNNWVLSRGAAAFFI